MPRTINESINQLETSLSDVKTSLTNKNVEGGGTPLKVSEVAGLIDQIETGNAGGFPLKGKYLSSNVEETIITYGVVDGPLGEKSFKINVDIDEPASRGYRLYFIKEEIDIKNCSESIDQGGVEIDLGKLSIHKEIDFTIEATGTNQTLIFVLYDHFNGTKRFNLDNFKDIIAIPVASN